MAQTTIQPAEFLSSLFHYARDFNYNHIIFDANRYKVSVQLMRRSATHGNAELFYVSLPTKAMAAVLSTVNGAIEMAEISGSQQATVHTPGLVRKEQVFQFKLREFGQGKYQLDLSI